MTIVSPGAYEHIEGEGDNAGCCAPQFRYQQVFPAADFAALGNQPHWIVGFSGRPDENAPTPGTVHFPDNEIRLSTMPVGPPNLSMDFDHNVGPDVMQFYRGPLIQVADAQGPGSGPREFYNSEFPAGVTPFLYDPSQGNLLFDVIAWQGVSSSTYGDRVPGIQSALASSDPLGTEGSPSAAAIFQFTFIPVTAGDYDRDGTVDAADYVVWRKTDGTQDGYNPWRANFGQTIGSGVALPSAEPLPIAVPEPAAWVMLLTAMLAMFSRRSDPAPCPALSVSG
jgi:hypothetical protein